MAATLIAGLATGTGRLLIVWLRERAAVQRMRVSEQGLCNRVLGLPAGSRFRERRADRREIMIEVGPRPEGGGDHE
ncbi:hypothetical protein [Streptomyces demainii]|uniref:Uncharacterized protein n=1 Tax=Streptomyces demainii TaxID=588122 RepID=A0ABT9KWU6_9ACTN|nr:hypothetical protein [Streptomyces demainii]MDP9612911.1 hypothetical protein [Streptomyces demainii]